MSTTTAPTLDDLATRLTSSRRNGSFVLSGATLGAQEMDDVLGSIGVLELVLDEPEIEKTADGLAVTGKADLLGMPDLDGRTTFSIEDGALSVSLTASYPDGAGIQLLGLPWASVNDLSLALDVVGPSLPLPVVSMVLSGAIELKGHAAPIAVTLTPSFGTDTWLLRATDIPLPDLTALTGLFPGQDGKALLPPGFGRIDGLEIVELTCAFTPGDWTVRNVAATVGAPGKEWEPVAGGPKLRDVRLSLGLEFDDEDSTSVTASARATLALGDLELPVRVIRQPGDRWRMGVIGAHGFPSLGKLVESATDAATAAMLPTGLRELQMASASLELMLGPGEPTLRSIFVSARLAEHWPIIEHHLALENVALELLVDRAAGDTSGFVTGTIHIEDFDLPVAVRMPDGSEPWTLTLGAAAAPTLSGVSSLAGIAGGDLAKHVPAGFGDGALTLNDLTIAFDPVTSSVSRISLDVHSDGPWSLPDLSEFDVRDLTLKLDVAWPGDSTRRAVTGTIGGIVDLAGPAIKISATKPTGEAPWELEGALQPGPPLDLVVLATKVLPGQPPLPPEVPTFALTTADLKLTPATGAFALKAGSAGPWPLPIGFSGVSISALDLALARVKSGADLTGSLSGTFTIGGAELRAVYALPGDLVLSGHVDSLRLAALVDDLIGPDLVAGLPMPDAFKQLELANLDFSLAPSQGRFMASAAVPGFDTAAILVQSGASGWGFALALAPAASWRLSSIDQSLSVLDDLSFGNTVLIVSTADDASAIGSLPVVAQRLKAGKLKAGQGLTLVADLALDGTGAEHILGMNELRVRAAIESPEKLTLEANVGGPFPLGDGVVLQEIDFRLSAGADAFELGLLGRIDVVFDPTSKLTFIGGLAVSPNKVTCAVTMLGTWNEPFGVKGVSVADVALELDWSYEGLPGIGIAGKTTIGDFHGEVALKFDPELPSRSMVVVRFDSLKLGDLLADLCDEILHDVIPPELVRTVFDISFKDVEIYVVPQDTKIGELQYKAGTRLKARMFFWGLEADARIEIDYRKGLLVDGQVDPIEFGEVFSLKGAGGQPKPHLHLEITEGKVPTVDVEGEVSLLGLTESIQLQISDTGFFFEVEGKLFDLFTCTLKATGGHLGDTNGFYVEATMTNDLFAYLREHAVAAIQEAAKSADRDIAGAIDDVKKAQGDLASIDREIVAVRRLVQAERDANRRTLQTSQTTVVEEKRRVVDDLGRQINELYAQISAQRTRDTQALVDAQRDVQSAQGQVDSLLAQINSTRVTIQGERDLANRRLSAAQADVDAAQRNVDSILATIRDKERWWNGLPDADWPWNESKSRDAVWYGPMIGGLYTGYGTATGVLQGYRGILDGIKAGAKYSAIDADPRITSLYAGYGTATAALETAKGVLEGAKGVQTLPPIEADPRLVALYGSQATAQAALDVAVAALSLVQTAGDAIPIDMDPRVVALLATKTLATLALQAAEGVLETTRITVAGTLQVSEYIVNYGLGGLVDVRAATLAGGLDAVHGGQVRLAADVEFLGEPQHLEFDFNFADLAVGVENLVKELMPA